MACHETKNCPRCKAPFECKVGSISLCQCNGIELSEEERAYINTHYEDCLCRNCLLQIKYESRYHTAQDKMQSILAATGKNAQ